MDLNWIHMLIFALFFSSIVCIRCNIFESNHIKYIENDIIKSQNDHRSYRALELNNDMKILLISDSNVKEYTAELEVNAGYLNDPKHLPGLAKYFGSQIFLASRTLKYPKEDGIVDFLKIHNNTIKVKTYADRTTFQFHTAPDLFPKALDRLAQLFISPQFSINKVKPLTEDAVFDMNSYNFELLYLLRSYSNATHDFYHQSIIENDMNSIELLKNKSSTLLLEEISKFYKAHYSSNLISMSITTNESLDHMMGMVVSMFSPIANKHFQVPYWPVHPYGPNQTGYHFEIECGYEVQMKPFIMFFPCPDYSNHFRSKPWAYVIQILGRKLAEWLSLKINLKTDTPTFLTKMHTLANGIGFFEISGWLKEEDLDNIENITMTIMQYINYLKGENIREWIYKEIEVNLKIKFNWNDNEDDFDRSILSSPPAAWYKVPPKYSICQNYILDKFRPDFIKQFMHHLNAENMNIYVWSRKNIEKTGVIKSGSEVIKYKMEKINKNLIQKMKESINAKTDSTISKPCQYMPENFKILKSDDSENSTIPQLIYESNGTYLWHLKDNVYFIPKVYLYFNLINPKLFSSALFAATCSVFSKMINDVIMPTTEDAGFGKIQYTYATCDRSGFLLYIEGFNDKVHDFVINVFKLITSKEFDEHEFTTAKKWSLDTITNFTKQLELSEEYYFDLLLTSNNWSTIDLINFMKSIPFNQIKKFRHEFFTDLQIKNFFYGNINKQGATRMLHKVKDILQKRYTIRPLLMNEFDRTRIVSIPEGKSYLYTDLSKHKKVSMVHVIFQTGSYSIKNVAVNALLGTILEDACAANEQINAETSQAYDYSCRSEQINGVNLIKFSFQNDKSPEYIDSQIEDLIKNLESDIERYITFNDNPGETFESYKKWHLDEYTKLRSMQETGSQFWSEILSGTNFFQSDVVADALRNISKDELVTFFKEMLGHSSHKRRKLSIYVYSFKNSAKRQRERIENKEMIMITNASAFKQSLPYYESVKQDTRTKMLERGTFT